jgi:DNA modification methylase
VAKKTAFKTEELAGSKKTGSGVVRIVCADCIDFLRSEGQSAIRYNMIFADPPFNIGQSYDTHDDRMAWDTYCNFTGRLIELLPMEMNGIICVHGNNQVSDLYRGCFRLRRPTFQEIARIIWHYRFGQHNHSNWINSYATCSVYARQQETPTWNPQDVLVESDRASKYGDRRTLQKTKGEPGKRLPFDVWGIPSDGEFWGRVQGGNKERCSKNNGYLADHPNQLPEVYLERLIRAYTNPGDWILDPFGGTGTTAVVARALGRNCTVVEKSPTYCRDIKTRVLRGAVRV